MKVRVNLNLLSCSRAWSMQGSGPLLTQRQLLTRTSIEKVTSDLTRSSGKT